MARLAVETGLFPLVEYKNVKLSKVRRLKEVKPVEDYLKKQARFKHLFEEKWQDILVEIKEIARKNIEDFGLLK